MGGMTEINYELIERYLCGEMSIREQRLFELELGRNNDLAEEYQFYKYVNHHIRAHISTNSFSGRKQKRKISGRWIAMLAISILACSTYLWFGWQIRSQTATDLSDSSVAIEASLSDLFQRQRYEELIRLADTLIGLDSSRADLYYLRGVSLLNTGRFTLAREDLFRAYSHSSRFVYEAAYHIGLSYIRDPKSASEAKAREWLEKVPAGHARYKAARRFVNAL